MLSDSYEKCVCTYALAYESRRQAVRALAQGETVSLRTTVTSMEVIVFLICRGGDYASYSVFLLFSFTMLISIQIRIDSMASFMISAVPHTRHLSA